MLDMQSRKRSIRQIIGTSTVMKKNLFRLFYLIGSILICILTMGCEQKASDYGNEVLLRVGERVLTVQ
jgi:hypothetical protein